MPLPPRRIPLASALIVVFLAAISPLCRAAPYYPGPPPGPASVAVESSKITAGTTAITAQWTLAPQGIRRLSVRDGQTGKSLDFHGEDFILITADGTSYPASALVPERAPRVLDVPTQPQSPRSAARLPAKMVEVPLRTADGRFRVLWRCVARDGANYLREEIEISSQAEDAELEEIVWLDESLPQAKPAGEVDGVPIQCGNFFLGGEDPHAQVSCDGKSACRIPCPIKLGKGDVYAADFILGVVPPGQVRRGFLYYLERERAHPYRPFLHYNSWFDISWGSVVLDDAVCLKAIRTFGERLIRPYGVVMDSFIFDDGWDDPQTLWEFHRKFPRGFSPEAELAREYGSRVGTWLSPHGGYGSSRKARLKFGRSQGFEINSSGFSLAGPKYYARFEKACVEMIRNYGVNYFKFDGIAKGIVVRGVAPECLPDTRAMCRLAGELRREDPEVFINLTTGSWPSPFWLRLVDSLWRQGWDVGFSGKGNRQQRWLTYRDQEVYNNVVRRSPLFPLGALMLHGVVLGQHGPSRIKEFTAAGLKDDIRIYFGSGVALQELYITPKRMTPEAWHVLAEAAKWSRASADVLADTHWIGGDPAKLEVYGYASWSPRKGIVTLRNPSDRPQEFSLDVGAAFELPPGAPQHYALKSPWSEDAAKPGLSATAGRPLPITLAPWQVLVFDALPEKNVKNSGK
ncbi:MAG: hypothetical protein JXB10_11715 [Pirellulales bacterium]|nr:hypothetical protein [Pirellulales bacterium]